MTAHTVWLASYPKSGNTWLRAVYTAWRQGGPVDVNRLDGGPVPAVREPLDVALGVPTSAMTAAEVEMVRPRVDELVAVEKAERHLRKVHDAYFPGPEGEPIVSTAATQGAIYVIRDPRAVAVSLAHHLGRPHARVRELLADPQCALSGTTDRLPEQVRQRLGTWSGHVRSWVDDTAFPVTVIRYEDAARAPVETFAGALRFAGFDVDDQALAAAVEHASFDRLRRAERDHGFREQSPEGGYFFRRGEAEAWREELAPDLAAGIAGDHADVMARFGYA